MFIASSIHMLLLNILVIVPCITTVLTQHHNMAVTLKNVATQICFLCWPWDVNTLRMLFVNQDMYLKLHVSIKV